MISEIIFLAVLLPMFTIATVYLLWQFASGAFGCDCRMCRDDRTRRGGWGLR